MMLLRMDQIIRLCRKTDGFHDSFMVELEWEHEEGIRYSPKPRSRSEQDLLEIMLRSPNKSSLFNTNGDNKMCADFEWDYLFDFGEVVRYGSTKVNGGENSVQISVQSK
ncbi:unnamed protein product [Didymodactylos carnosus]|uniref:Uncharacterized protein n=1 Tax=Didymodactylos carnosus TaxID=1234261 RepID=A0A813SFE5_9BILA|nr:unnamed protein product [Didymodactylos carnosus]CAF0921256.1 unnamed protein product [Didymodactylos carnosus]CAF3580528.1 unnamed protein product [Didymodactylos carnosus]CAF3698704.1 unnamed protein product [Didymodactylos carnosus]